MIRLRLFVDGEHKASTRARHNLATVISEIAEAEIEVVDLATDPGAATQHRIIATPLLERLTPAPVIRILGTLDEPAVVRTLLRTVPAKEFP